MANIKDIIKDIEREIEKDLEEIKYNDERILRLESDTEDAKQRIKENRKLLEQLKSLLNKEASNEENN